MSLAGSRGGAPLWGLGQRPNCFTCDHSKGKINKGAGSEASLPVTLRSRRSAPKPLYSLLAYCRVRWTRPDCMSSRHSEAFPEAGDFASAGANQHARKPESALNSIAKWVSRGSKTLRGVQRQSLWWGQGATPLGFPPQLHKKASPTGIAVLPGMLLYSLILFPDSTAPSACAFSLLASAHST